MKIFSTGQRYEQVLRRRNTNFQIALNYYYESEIIRKILIKENLVFAFVHQIGKNIKNNINSIAKKSIQ